MIIFRHLNLRTACRPLGTAAIFLAFSSAGVGHPTAVAAPERNVSVIARGWVTLEPVRATAARDYLWVRMIVRTDFGSRRRIWSGFIDARVDHASWVRFSETAVRAQPVSAMMALPGHTQRVTIRLETADRPVTSYFTVCVNHHGSTVVEKWHKVVGLLVN